MVNPGDRVKISENAMEDAPASHPEPFIISKYAGMVGIFKGDMIIGEEPFAVIGFDDERHVTIPKQDIEPL